MSTADERGTLRVGRPPADGDEVSVRLTRPLLDALDAFAADQGEPAPSRPEAVRLVLADRLEAKGYLPTQGTDDPGAPGGSLAENRYTDADPNEAVMVTGVGPMILRRAVRKYHDWRDHHGLSLVSVYRGADKEPGVFDIGDLGRLAEMDRFK